MCAALMGVPAGNPERFTTYVAVALVTLPAASLVVTSVTVAVPLPVASAPAITGTSFAGSRFAVNVGLVGVVGAVEELPHADANTPRAVTRTEKRFIGSTPFERLRISKTYGSD